MMVKWGNDGVLQANDGKMLVKDGEMLDNDGEMLVNDGDKYMIIHSFHHSGCTMYTVHCIHFTIIIKHFTITDCPVSYHVFAGGGLENFDKTQVREGVNKQKSLQTFYKK